LAAHQLVKWPSSAALSLTPLALAAMLLSNDCRADWKVQPVIQLRETYSDNVNNQSGDLGQASFVSESTPSLTVIGNGPRLKVNAKAEWSAYAYSKGDIPNVQNSERRYAATARADVVDEFLYIDANANRSRRTVSPFGPITTNTFSSLNSTEISMWSISPNVRHRFGSFAIATARVSRDSVESKPEVGFGNSLGTTRSADLVSGNAFVNAGWNLSYTHQDLETGRYGSTSSETWLAGARWKVQPHLNLTATTGYDKYNYSTTLGQTTQGRSWSTGFLWTPSTRTNVQASVGRRYFGKTAKLDASYRTPHSQWALTYDDAITTSRQQLMLPAAFDTASMLDHLFASLYPDPQTRQQIVQAYMASNGLPATLADNINYLSNRYQRNKQLQGAVTFRGAHSDLLLTVFKNERQAVSQQQTDSALVPPQLNALNNNSHQRGASAYFNYRLSSRTTAQASASINRVLSIDTGIVNNMRDVTIGMTRRLAPKISAAVDVRHHDGRAGATINGNIRENAIAATLNVQY
jgi:uncharacterized protein (PEP-CTERM system associated)